MNWLCGSAKWLWRFAFFRFAAVGGMGFIVNAVALSIAINLLGTGPRIGWFIAFLPAVTFTWWGNRKFTFPERASVTLRAGFREWARFVLTNSVGALVNFAAYNILLSWAAAPLDNPFLALAAGVLLGLVFNFTLSRWFVFRPVSARHPR